MNSIHLSNFKSFKQFGQHVSDRGVLFKGKVYKLISRFRASLTQFSGRIHFGMAGQRAFNARALLGDDKTRSIIPITSIHSANYKKNIERKSSLENNLKLADEILKEVRASVLYSYNDLSRHPNHIDHLNNRTENQFFENFSRLWQRNNDIIKFLRNMVWDEYDSKPVQEQTPFLLTKVRAKLAAKYNVGNCCEMVAVALFRLMQKGIWNIRLDMAFIEKGDHVFLVIGRAKDSKPNDYKSWGPDAVICDIWSNCIFPASEIEQKLKDSLGNGQDSGQALIKPFDPKTQSLNVFVSNLVSPEELEQQALLFKRELIEASLFKLEQKQASLFKREQKIKFQELKAELDNFYKTHTLTDKLKCADNMLKTLKEPGFVNSKAVATLRQQLEYFKYLSSFVRD